MIGTTLAGHYKIVKSLSAGGFGETYVAEDTHRPGNPQGIPQTVQGSRTVSIGTPGYMPTEQGRGKPRPSSDLYALGIVAIQAAEAERH